MTTEIDGTLEIDHERGVIYFHTKDEKIARDYGSVSILRICSLPAPIPKEALDITFGFGVSWRGDKRPFLSSLLENNL